AHQRRPRRRRALQRQGLRDLAGLGVDPHRRGEGKVTRRGEADRSRTRARESRDPDQPRADQVRAPWAQSAQGRGVGTHGVARRRGESEMTVEIKSQVPDSYKYGWYDKEAPINVKHKGLSPEVVSEISQTFKHEPEWMLQRRLKALRHFEARAMPTWGADLSPLDFQDIYYYVLASDKRAQSWEDVPGYVKDTFDKLGIPQAEQKYLAGVGAQYDSEVVYHNIRKDLEKLGVIFMDTDTALKEHEDIVKKYFGTVIPANDNKMAALNTAVWSGGSFVYVPAGVKVEIPLQAYFRINSENMGQFERTLIVAEEGSSVHYVEGCTAPVFTGNTMQPEPNTTSISQSKAVSKETGQQTDRGMVKSDPGAHGAKSTVRCDALILDETARSDTYPYMEVDEEDVTIGHEASVSKVG